MKHVTHDDVIKRLKRADGHLRKVIQMIGDERACIDVAPQLHAVCKAVEQAKRIYVHDHVDHCLDAGVSRSGKTARSLVAELKEITRYL
ncbi:MAG: metal-sensing transcriptional repressor [Rhodospirillales bacterium]|nr:metal-sensing transcriptional repressor [Rhodospirillales bacterium]